MIKPGKFLLIICILVVVNGCTGTIDKSNTHLKGGLLYKINSDVPYTGIVIDYYNFALKKIKTREEYQEGNLHGTYAEYYENGQKKIICSYSRGKFSGEYKSWYENGQLQSNAFYDSSKICSKIDNWKINGDRSETKYELNKFPLSLAEVLSFINKPATEVIDYWGFPAENDNVGTSLAIKYNFYKNFIEQKTLLSFNYLHQGNNIIPAGISIIYYNSSPEGLKLTSELISDSLSRYGFRKTGENEWENDHLLVKSMVIFDNIMYVFSQRNSDQEQH